MVHQRRPDGGWGWVIVTVSFFTQFLGYGSPLAVGVLYVEWLDVFNEGKGKTAWVGSLAAGVGLIASPLCSASVSSFGARPVAILSGVLVAGGLILSSFAPSLYFLYFSYGFLLGIGCGLLYTATITVTCQYFENRRGLALGIISTGSSVGTFIYAGLQKELIILYGLDGCLLIVGALSLNIIACGILMRPLSELSISLQEKPCLEKVPETYLIYNEKELNIEENLVILEKISNNEKSLTLVTNGDCTQDNMLNKNGFTFPHVTEKDSFLNNNTDASIGKKLAQNYGLRYMTYWRDTVDLFRNKVFSSLFVAILLFDIGGFPPALLLEDVAKSSNIDEESMIVPLVSIIGFTVAIGKLFLGILADFKWINTLYLYVITLLGTGLALFAVPFAKSYISLAILAAILGFFSGNWSIFPYVTTKTVGLDKLTHAYGILMLFAGAGNCLGPPIFGWLFDWTQSYDIAFYFSGICVLSGGCLLLLVALPFWDNRMSKKSKELQEFYSYEAASKA